MTFAASDGSNADESPGEPDAGTSRRRSELPCSDQSDMAACGSALWPTFVRDSPAATRALFPVHAASAATTSAAVWNRSAGFFASIFATTAPSAAGSAASAASNSGAAFNWCCISFCVVFPPNGVLPTTSV